MKLAHSDYEALFSFQNTECIEWVIESPVIYRNVINELMDQLEEKEGNFVLSEDDKILPIHKNMELILNLFSIDVNQKKLLNRLYAEMKDISYGEKYYIQT